MITPTEPTTPEGWTVAGWAAIVACLAIAGVAFYWSFRAPAPDDASSLRAVGFVCIGIAAVVFIAKKLIATFLDS